MLRINESIRQALTDAIGELDDPRIGFVTITGVTVDRDLSVARVYVSVLGDDQQRDETMRALAHSIGLLRRAVSRQVKLRRTPELRLESDRSADMAMRMRELMDDEPSPAVPVDESQQQEN